MFLSKLFQMRFYMQSFILANILSAAEAAANRWAAVTMIANKIPPAGTQVSSGYTWHTWGVTGIRGSSLEKNRDNYATWISSSGFKPKRWILNRKTTTAICRCRKPLNQ